MPGWCRYLTLLILAGSLGKPCPAVEPYLAFLRGLHERGYGEQALEYLDHVAGQKDAPAELKATIDLERSKSLRLAAAEAYDAQQRQSRLDEAKRLAEQFFADNPSHPLAGAALLGEADESLVRGQISLAQSRAAHDLVAVKQSLEDARTALSAARTQYDEVVKRLQEKLDRAQPAVGKPRQDAAHEELEFTWLDARFKSALATYFLAMAHDAKDQERTDLLQAAGKVFDAIFQEYRTSGKPIAMLPHMWHGKTLEELGDTELALEIYDEVLAVAPEGDEATERNADLSPVFGQAFLFQMRLLAQREGAVPKDLLADAQEWLDLHKNWQATGPYQGIALEAAKLRLSLADKSARGPAERARLIREAAALLAAIGKVESEYRHEALLARREALEKAGTSAAMSLDDRLGLGDEAVAEKNWDGAEPIFREALALAAKARDTERTLVLKQRLASVLYQQALKAYSNDDMERVLTLAGQIVRDNSDDPLAQSAAAIAMAAALDLYTAADDDAKAAALARLDKVAQYALGRWPDAPVADDARMALAQTRLMDGKLEGALEYLAKVNSQSKRYPTALQILGQIRWKQYLDGMQAADAQDRAAELARLREEAVTSLKASTQRQTSAWQAATEPMPAALRDTQLLLAETHLEGKQPAEAAVLFGPLVAETLKHPPPAIDLPTQRTLVGATRAQLGAGGHAEACQTALVLAGLSPDASQPNTLLIDLSKLLAQEIRKLETSDAPPAPAPMEPAPAGVPLTLNPAVVTLREGQGKLLAALAARKEVTVPQMIYLGDASVIVGKSDEARVIYARLLEAIDKDESAKETAGAAVTRIRARLVGLLRSEGQLEEANKQVDALLKSHPNALEPLLEKGHILEALAEKDPARWDECVAHWTNLRVQLGRAKTRPPEYYDVLYSAARCLVVQARRTKNKEQALQAEQMLKSTLTLTPKLSGPEMVAKYKTLLASAVSLRTDPTAGAGLKVKGK